MSGQVVKRPRALQDLVFYRPFTDGIEVLRVLGGARDIHSILAEEFGGEADAEQADEPDSSG